MNTTTVSYLQNISTNLIVYTGIPFTAINIISNVINIIIFAREKMRKTTTGFYLMCLSILDLTQSYVILVYYLTQRGIFFQVSSTLICKIHSYVFPTIPMLPPWILVVVSLDRLISVKFIKLVSLLKKRSFQITIVIVTLVSFMFLNIGLLIHNDVFVAQSTLACKTKSVIAYSFGILGFIYCAFITSWLPFFLMTIFNILTVYTLIQSKKRSSKKVDFSKEKQFATTLIGLNIVFFICYLPPCIFYYLLTYTDVPVEKGVEVKSGLVFGKTISMYGRFIYSSLQIFVYLGVNHVYRSEFLKLFGLNKYITTGSEMSKSAATTQSKI